MSVGAPGPGRPLAAANCNARLDLQQDQETLSQRISLGRALETERRRRANGRKPVGPRGLSKLKPAGGGHGGRTAPAPVGAAVSVGRVLVGGSMHVSPRPGTISGAKLAGGGLSRRHVSPGGRRHFSFRACNRRHSVRKNRGPGHCSAKDGISWTSGLCYPWPKATL
jgi:hypothetical protein